MIPARYLSRISGPLMDRFEPPRIGRRRGWLVFTQVGLAIACFAMASLDPARQVPAVGAVAVAIAFLSASQDIVFDAYRSDRISPLEVADYLGIRFSQLSALEAVV